MNRPTYQPSYTKRRRSRSIVGDLLSIAYSLLIFVGWLFLLYWALSGHHEAEFYRLVALIGVACLWGIANRTGKKQ